MPTSFKLKGGPELLALLDQLPKRWAEKVVRGGARAAAVVIQNEAKSRVRRKSGKLAKAIKVSSRSDRGLVIARVRVKGGKNSHAFLAPFLEYGVMPHEIDPKKNPKGFFAKPKQALRLGENMVRGHVFHPGFGAMPFMRPALDAKAQEAINRMGEYIASRLTWDELQAPTVVVEEDEE